MKLFNRRRKSSQERGSEPDPSQIPDPQTTDDYFLRGYSFYSRGRLTEAESDFRKAIDLNSKAVDAYYALGMVLKAQKRAEDSVQVFRKTIELLDGGTVEDRVRTTMLRRLALGHINELTQGDWNLEKEIWQHVA